MRKYQLKLRRPAWLSDEPTSRQLKVLKFFGMTIPQGLTKGVASGMVARLFKEEKNKEIWEKYVYHTGDESQDSANLQPFDLAELQAVIVPEHWKPKRTQHTPSNRQMRQLEIITEIMREGSPFDDPVPKISFNGTSFAFTGKFASGTRAECQEAVENLGADAQTRVSGNTNYLVIGSQGSKDWSKGTHGQKIEKAMMLRMESGKPAILSEADWLLAIQSHKSEHSENPSLGLLEKLTKSGRIERRSRKLLKPPKGASESDWFMYVPETFNSALDIKFGTQEPNKGWTQAGSFSFKVADTLYDTDEAYKTWSQALSKIRVAVIVTSAAPAGQGVDGQRFPGRVDFRVLTPNKNKTALEAVFDWALTQDEFVKFLVAGPQGDFKEKLKRGCGLNLSVSQSRL